MLIHYRGGCYGNFLHQSFTQHFTDTVKISEDFSFSAQGDSHASVKYITPYDLASKLDTARITHYGDYDHQPEITHAAASHQILVEGRIFLLLCDTAVVDNHAYLLETWPQARMIRVFMPTWQDRLVAYVNLIRKVSETHPLYRSKFVQYKKCLFDQHTLHQLAHEPGDLDQNIINLTVQTFRKDFGIHGVSFVRAVHHPRVFNISLSVFNHHDSFISMMHQVADFLGTKVLDADQLSACYHQFAQHQPALEYYHYTEHTEPDAEDLTAQALVRYLREETA